MKIKIHVNDEKSVSLAEIALERDLAREVALGVDEVRKMAWRLTDGACE